MMTARAPADSYPEAEACAATRRFDVTVSGLAGPLHGLTLTCDAFAAVDDLELAKIPIEAGPPVVPARLKSRERSHDRGRNTAAQPVRSTTSERRRRDKGMKAVKKEMSPVALLPDGKVHWAEHSAGSSL